MFAPHIICGCEPGLNDTLRLAPRKLAMPMYNKAQVCKSRMRILKAYDEMKPTLNDTSLPVTKSVRP